MLKNKPYLKRWAEAKNLQIAAEVYTRIKRAGYSSLEDALSKLDVSKEKAKTEHSKALSNDKKMKKVSYVIGYLSQYDENLSFKRRYERSKDPESFFRRHEAEISLCEGAEYMLKREGLDPEQLDISALRSDFETMKKEKESHMAEYARFKADVKKLEHLTDTLERFLKKHDQDRTLEDTKERSKDFTNKSRDKNGSDSLS